MDRHNNTDNSLVRMKSRLKSPPVPYFLHSTHQHFDNTIPWRLGWCFNIALNANLPKSKSMDRHNNTDNSLVRMKSRLKSPPVPYFLHSTHQHFDNTIYWRLGWFSNIALHANQPKSKVNGPTRQHRQQPGENEISSPIATSALLSSFNPPTLRQYNPLKVGMVFQHRS